MQHTFGQLVRATPLWATPVGQIYQQWRSGREIRRWEAIGRPAPPPHAVKQRIIRNYVRRFGPRTFVETGTFQGDMVAAALRLGFERLYSIELSDTLAKKARKRFSRHPQVTILQGDSGILLADLLPITVPTLFWLDGHWSGGDTAHGDGATPVTSELDNILRTDPSRHVILIDDARLFGTDPEYPSVEEIRASVDRQHPGLRVWVKNDIIRIHR